MTSSKPSKLENGMVEWRLNGQLHREDGPAIEGAHGITKWYLWGLRHREDGPAIEKSDGTKYWYMNGLLHRTDGPAIERPGGYVEYWYMSKRVDKDYFLSDEFKIRLVMEE